MKKITLELPDQMFEQINLQSESIEDILLTALEDYFAKQKLDITKTKTWELCGSLEITNPETEYLVQGNDGKLYTNYAENIDQSLS